MQKNVAGQKWQVFAFDRTDNTPKTGDAAQITANLRKDWGSAAATNDTNPTELEDGFYVFDLTQTETNADVLALAPESSTADVQVIATPGVFYTTDAIAAGVTPTATGTYLGDLEARRDAVAAELAAISTSKAGGLPNVLAARGAGGVGLNVDHVGYRQSLLDELARLDALIAKAKQQAQADAGDVGVFESEEYV